MEELESLLAATGWWFFGRRCDDSVSLYLAVCLVVSVYVVHTNVLCSSWKLLTCASTWPFSAGHAHVMAKQDVREDLVPSRASAPDEAGDEGADLGEPAAEVRDGNVTEQENERHDGEVDAEASDVMIRDGVGEKSSTMDEARSKREECK